MSAEELEREYGVLRVAWVDGSRLSDGLEAPPPDRSWVTTEDITARPTRPSPMRPAEGGIGFWVSIGLGIVAFAAWIVLLVLALS